MGAYSEMDIDMQYGSDSPFTSDNEASESRQAESRTPQAATPAAAAQHQRTRMKSAGPMRNPKPSERRNGKPDSRPKKPPNRSSWISWPL